MVLESRRHFRVKDYLRVQWTVTVDRSGKAVATGEATILDISASGLRIFTDKAFTPFDKCVFLIEAPFGEKIPFGPKKAKMIWFRKAKKEGVDCMLCGLEFHKDSGFDKELKEWLDEKVTKLSDALDAKILTNYLY